MDDGDSSLEFGPPRVDGDDDTEPPAGLRLEVDISEDEEGAGGLWDAIPDRRAAIRAAAAAVSRAPDLDLEPSLATVALSGDARVRELNRAFRGKDKPTNVLSFPSPEGPEREVSARRFLGDVVLAAETVLQEAEAMGVPPRHHLQHLVVHGLLHLLGFDHETDDEATEMEALETRLLDGLGIADPYGEPAA